MTIILTVNGEEFTVRPGALTAIDARDFQAKVGTTLAKVFSQPDTADLHILAGLAWLAQRKINPALTFESVAKSVTYESALSVTAANETGEGDGSPEA